MSIPSVGQVIATAVMASTSGNVRHFQSARHFVSLLVLTSTETSSGHIRHMGRISKRRLLSAHAARSVMRATTVAQRAGWSRIITTSDCFGQAIFQRE
ncbi:MAG: IS110 family transposase [Betaproteobacteria bacterium]|nr:IS110 family transposase [Betaproteobacteria bacterium]